MKALISGGAGFLGSRIARKLLDKGVDVTLYDCLVHGDKRPNGDHKLFFDATFVDGDIRDEEFTREMILNFEPDYIVHCAAIAGIDTVGKLPADTVETNILGTWNVLRAASLMEKGLKRLIFFSTSEIYGTEAFRAAEDSPASIGPVGYSRWVYAATKLAGEHMTKAFHSQHDMPTVTVRPFNVYGPGQIGDSAMKTFIEKAIADEDITVFGGDQIRAWCFIDDFVKGFMPLLTDDRAIGETFNIGNEKSALSIHGLAGLVVGLTGSKSGVWVNEASEADIALRVPSVDKLRDMFKYEASVGLEEGIKRTEEWIRNEKA